MRGGGARGHLLGRPEISDEKLCVVCIDAEANQVLLPCGHVCVCANCVSSIQQQCPLCREPCTSTHTIYT